LTFSAFDIDDFDNGVGQFQVLVNGHLVVDIPAGLNHLTGSGDYGPYENTWVNFGPFDITGLVVRGQNTVLFMDPQTSDHFGRVRNVTIVQGDTVLLHVERARGVYPGFSFAYTFSIPPLRITSFNSQATPNVDQSVMFSATYTGGTGPFRCVFRFGDDERATVTGSSGNCSATHVYDDQGTFTATVTVIGASTSDVQMARLSITIVKSGSSALVVLTVHNGPLSVATDDEDFTDLQVNLDN
jgi:PKD repeat protein